MSEWHKLPLSSKVCESQTKLLEYLKEKKCPFMAKTKKEKRGNHSNSKIKSKKQKS